MQNARSRPEQPSSSSNESPDEWARSVSLIAMVIIGGALTLGGLALFSDQALDSDIWGFKDRDSRARASAMVFDAPYTSSINIRTRSIEQRMHDAEAELRRASEGDRPRIESRLQQAQRDRESLQVEVARMTELDAQRKREFAIESVRQGPRRLMFALLQIALGAAIFGFIWYGKRRARRLLRTEA